MSRDILRDSPYVIAIVSFIMLMNYIVQRVGEYHYSKHGNNKLFDLFHTILPKINPNSIIYNLIPASILIFTILQPNSSEIFKDFFIKFALVMFVRALTIISTILPKDEHCDIKVDFFSLINGGCYDKVFSGHTALVTLLSLELYKYNALTIPAIIAIIAANSLILLLTRSHYTVDIVLAILISYLVYDGDYSIFTKYVR